MFFKVDFNQVLVLKTELMIKRRIFFTILIMGILISSCAPKRKGMRKSRKRDCDCPSFGHIQTKPAQNLKEWSNNKMDEAKERQRNTSQVSS